MAPASPGFCGGRSSWLLLLALTAACSATKVTAVSEPGQPQAYAIECIRLHDCWAEARRACGGDYRKLSLTKNEIPESELPGLNARTASHDHNHNDSVADTMNNTPMGGPGIESSDPMPLTEVVVECTADG